MAVWSLRTTKYKVGVLMLFLGAGLYLLGFVSPFWIEHDSHSHYYDYGYNREVFGLWMSCEYSFDWPVSYDEYEIRPSTPPSLECRFHRSFDDVLLRIVLILQCLGLLGVILSCVYAVVVNCCKKTVYHNECLEIMWALSGMLGLIGCVVLAGPSLEYWDVIRWGFGVNFTGCILLMVANFLILLSGRVKLSTLPPGMTAIGAPSAQGDNMEMMPLSQMEPGNIYPPQAGTGYNLQSGYGYPQGYPQNYPQGYPQNYPQGYPQNYPQGCPQGYPQGYTDPAPCYAPAFTHAGFAPQLRVVGASGVTPPQAASAPGVTPPQAASTLGVTPPQAASTPGVTPPQAASTPGVAPPQTTSTPGVTPPQAASTPGATPPQAASTPIVTPLQAASTPGVTPPQAASTPGVAPHQAASTPALQAVDTPQSTVELDNAQNVSLEQMYKVWSKGRPQ